MPRITRPSRVTIPVSVEVAAAVFGKSAVMALIRHYQRTPSHQSDACEALGLPHPTVSGYTRDLLDAGVLYFDEDGEDRHPNGRIYHVDVERVRQLLREVRDYLLPDAW